MIVSSVKVRDVRNALERMGNCGEIILRGPSGCGKFSALQHACSELDIQISIYQGVDGYIEGFLGSCLRQFTTSGKRLVAFCPGVDCLEYYCKHFDTLSKLQICKVFSVQDGCMASYIAMQRLTSAILIPFNALSDIALGKNIMENVHPDNLSVVRNMITGSGGDIRQATNQLRSAGLIDLSRKHIHEKPPRASKRSLHAEGCSDTANRQCNPKDTMYSFFHILGKILYNKEGTIARVDDLIRDPIIENAGIVPIGWIHENVIDFASDIEELLPIMRNIIYVDSFGNVGEGDLACLSVGVVFKSVCLRPMGDIPKPRRGFAPLRKPHLYECHRRAAEMILRLKQAGDRRLMDQRIHHLVEMASRLREPFNPFSAIDIDLDPIEEC